MPMPWPVACLQHLGIDRAKAPYAELRDLLHQLDYHPLAIQLVLPALGASSLTLANDHSRFFVAAAPLSQMI